MFGVLLPVVSALSCVAGVIIGAVWQRDRVSTACAHIWGPWEDAKLTHYGEIRDGQKRWCMSCNEREVRHVWPL